MLGTPAADPALLRTPVIRVPVTSLARGEGIIARAITSPDGSFSIPAGVDLALFDRSAEMIVKKIAAAGIDYVYIQRPEELSEQDIDTIIDRVYSDGGVISKAKAETAIGEVDGMFRKIDDEDGGRRAVEAMTARSADLARELMRDPSVSFSLGRVRNADEYTFIHSYNVSIICGYLAGKLRPGDRAFVEKMVLGGLMHDLGKAQIPKEVLNKPGPLSSAEFELMKRHPAIGVQLAVRSGISDADVLACVGGHHEKWSGKGYPNRRAGLDIPEAARIAAVADVFDALTAKRVYKQPMSSRNAVTMILNGSGSHFDAKVSRALLVAIGLYPPGSIVQLSDGRRGVVVSGGGRDLISPVVMIEDERSRPTDIPIFIDLREHRGVRIAQYLGHGSKRDVSVSYPWR